MAKGKAKDITAKVGRMPSQKEIQFDLKMMRWMNFLKKHGESANVYNKRDQAVHDRLRVEFEKLEQQRPMRKRACGEGDTPLS